MLQTKPQNNCAWVGKLRKEATNKVMVNLTSSSLRTKSLLA